MLKTILVSMALITAGVAPVAADASVAADGYPSPYQKKAYER